MPDNAVSPTVRKAHVYKCSDCGFATTEGENLQRVQACCGRKIYKCPRCGHQNMNMIETR